MCPVYPVYAVRLQIQLSLLPSSLPQWWRLTVVQQQQQEEDEGWWRWARKNWIEQSQFRFVFATPVCVSNTLHYNFMACEFCAVIPRVVNTTNNIIHPLWSSWTRIMQFWCSISHAASGQSPATHISEAARDYFMSISHFAIVNRKRDFNIYLPGPFCEPLRLMINDLQGALLEAGQLTRG